MENILDERGDETREMHGRLQSRPSVATSLLLPKFDTVHSRSRLPVGLIFFNLIVKLQKHRALK